MTSPTEPREGAPRPAGLGTNTAWNAADLMVGTVAAIVNSVVVARALGPTILGHYQLILWAAAVVSVFTMHGLPATANRYIARYLARGRSDLAGEVLVRALRFQALFALAALVAGVTFGVTREAADRPVILLVFLSLVPSLLQAVPSGLNGIDERFSRNVIPSLVAEVGGTIGIVAVALNGGGLTALAAVTLTSRIVDASLRYSLAWGRLKALIARRSRDLPDPDWQDFRQMIWQSILTQLLMFIVWDRSEVLFLEWLSTPEQLAFFSISFGLAVRLRLIALVTFRAQAPRILKGFGISAENARAATLAAMRQQLVIAIPAHLLAIAFAYDAVALLYGDQYHAAIPVMMILAALMLPAAVVQPVEALLTAVDGRRSILRVTAFTAVIAMATDYVLISRFDAIGAGTANGLVALSQAVLLIGYARHVSGFRLGGLRPWGLLVLGAGAVGVARLVTLGQPHLLALVVGGVVGVGLYLLGLWKGPFLSVYERDRLTQLLRRGQPSPSS